MPPGTPHAELVLSALAAQLLAKIQGSPDYFNVLSFVGRPPSWEQFDLSQIQRNHTCQAMIRPGFEPILEETTGTVEGQLEVWILAVAKHAPKSIDPQQQNPPQDAQTRQNELISDFERAILADVSLGGPAFNAEIRSIDRGQHIEGWVVAELFLVVSYSALRGSP